MRVPSHSVQYAFYLLRRKTVTIKVNKTKDYTVMSNTHFREKNMSLKAKGLLSLMLSLPSDWDYSINGLVSICKENETAITSTLKELKLFGYLTVTKVMPNETSSGRIEYIYEIHENPKVQNQGLEIQVIEKQGIENLPLVSQKEKSTKKEKDIYIYSNIINKENTKNELKKENNIKEKAHRTTKEFVPPTFEEVLEYAKSRKREDLARTFFDYFEAGDWIDSKGVKVRSWKQKFITWENNNPINKGGNNAGAKQGANGDGSSELPERYGENYW